MKVKKFRYRTTISFSNTIKISDDSPIDKKLHQALIDIYSEIDKQNIFIQFEDAIEESPYFSILSFFQKDNRKMPYTFSIFEDNICLTVRATFGIPVVEIID